MNAEIISALKIVLTTFVCSALIMPFAVGYLASHFSYFFGFLFMMIISTVCYIIAIYIMWQNKRRSIIKEKMDNIIKKADEPYKK